VITFGAQSAVDWTWFVPGVAVPALICAGWLAGRGPLERPVGRGPGRVRRLRTPAIGAVVTAFVAVFVLGAWAMLQPLRSQQADAAAITALSNHNAGTALADARTAANSDPLSIDPYRVLSQIYVTLSDPRSARAELVQATTVQPRNAEPWRWLAEYDLGAKHFGRALTELNSALSLDLGSLATRQDIVQTLAEKYAPRAPSSPAKAP
jgi:cytochrome c-type biogenesis protein CcmH/NrfG